MAKMPLVRSSTGMMCDFEKGNSDGKGKSGVVLLAWSKDDVKVFVGWQKKGFPGLRRPRSLVARRGCGRTEGDEIWGFYFGQSDGKLASRSPSPPLTFER